MKKLRDTKPKPSSIMYLPKERTNKNLNFKLLQFVVLSFF